MCAYVHLICVHVCHQVLHKVVFFALDEEAALMVQQSGIQLRLVISLYNAVPRMCAT